MKKKIIPMLHGVLKIDNNIFEILFKEYPTVSDDGEYDLFVFESTDKNLIKRKFLNINHCTVNILNGDLIIFYDINIRSNSISFKDCELITKDSTI